MLGAASSLVGAQNECPNPNLIDTITGSGDQDSPPFTTTTNSFRISYQTTANDPQAPFYADVQNADPNGPPPTSGSISRNGSASGQSFANVAPGRYFLSILTTPGTQYTIRIEECGPGGQANPGEGTSGTGPTTTAPKAATPAPPKATPPAPPSPPPQPKASPPPTPPLMNAGGPTDDVPLMPNGGCPKEYPVEKHHLCYVSGRL